MLAIRGFAAVLFAGLCVLTVSGIALRAEDEKKADDADLATARQASANNLKQLALAVIQYCDQNKGTVPPPAVLDKDGKPLYSWRVLVLPFLNEEKLYKEFHLDEPWDSEHNKTLLEKMPKVFAPVRGKTKEPHATYYQAIVGPGAGFEERQRPRFPASFTDGTSNTIMLAEAAEAVPWTKPAELDYDPKKPLPKFGTLFPDGFHVALWDGSAHLFKKDFDEQQMRFVITRSGGEVADFSMLVP
jgi:hypothetical protein